MEEEELEPTIHVLTEGNLTTYCSGGIIGDRAITLQQALELDNDMYFNCHACYLGITANLDTEKE